MPVMSQSQERCNIRQLGTCTCNTNTSVCACTKKNATARACERIDGVELPPAPVFLMARSSTLSRAWSAGPVPRSTIWSPRGVLRALLLSKVGSLDVTSTLQTRHVDRCGFDVAVLVGEWEAERGTEEEVVWQRPLSSPCPPRFIHLRSLGLMAVRAR
jgi:hypothetical protein